MSLELYQWCSYRCENSVRLQGAQAQEEGFEELHFGVEEIVDCQKRCNSLGAMRDNLMAGKAEVSFRSAASAKNTGSSYLHGFVAVHHVRSPWSYGRFGVSLSELSIIQRLPRLAYSRHLAGRP